MNTTLKRIVKRANTRKIIGKKAAWYKISRGGKCPDKDEDRTKIRDNYYKHFGCDSYNHRETTEMRGKDAGQCAAERMADMKKKALKDDTTDKDHINHIKPIKFAYDMGKFCLKNTLLYDSYINKFKKYYKELIAVKPKLHDLFQTTLKVEGEYPLEVNTENSKEIETKNPIVYQTNNPIIYQNNKTVKRTNTQKSNNKTIK